MYVSPRRLFVHTCVSLRMLEMCVCLPYLAQCTKSPRMCVSTRVLVSLQPLCSHPFCAKWTSQSGNTPPRQRLLKQSSGPGPNQTVESGTWTSRGSHLIREAVGVRYSATLSGTILGLTGRSPQLMLMVNNQISFRCSTATLQVSAAPARPSGSLKVCGLIKMISSNIIRCPRRSVSSSTEKPSK